MWPVQALLPSKCWPSSEGRQSFWNYWPSPVDTQSCPLFLNAERSIRLYCLNRIKQGSLPWQWKKCSRVSCTRPQGRNHLMRKEWRLSWFSLSLLFLHGSFACLLDDGRSAVYWSINEDHKPGTLIGTLPIRGDVMDETSSDSKKAGGIQLRLIKGGEFIELKRNTKEVILRKELDRDEGMNKFEAVFECKADDSNEINQLNIPLVVAVQDVNDNAPLFDQPEYRVSIHEELPLGTIVFADFEAVDADQSGPNSAVRYSILPGKHSDFLDIPDPMRPMITVKKRMNFEAPLHAFSVQLQAKDQGQPLKATVVPFKVTVLDIDDLPPIFDHRYYYSSQIESGELVVGPVAILARDGDAINTKILYELAGELDEHFAIDDSGRVRIRSNPPPPLATLFIHAYQENNHERNATAVLYVDLLPTLQFEFDRYAAQIRSDSLPNTLITQVRALSRNEKALVHYSVNESDSLVTVDEKFGKVLFKGNNRQKQRSGHVSYTILANDGRQTARTRLHLYLSPDASCADGIRFEHDSFEMELPSDGRSVLGDLSLAPGNEPAAIRLHNLNRYFSVEESGRVSAIGGAGNPPCDVCELVVSATDRDGRVALAKVLVKNGSLSLATSSLLSILLLVVVVLLLCLLALFICRRISYAYVVNSSSGDVKKNKKKSTPVVSSRLQVSTPVMRIEATTVPPTGLTVKPHTRPVSGASGNAHPASVLRVPSSNGAAHLVPITVTTQEGAPTVYF